MTNETAPFALPKVLKMHTSQKDIAGAVCNSRTHCVIACDLYRELKLDVGRVRVSMAGVSIVKDGYRYYYRVPRKACKMVVAFDQHLEVQPMAYQLHFSNRVKIKPTPPARKARINAARQARTDTLAALGLKPKKYPKGRYGGL